MSANPRMDRLTAHKTPFERDRFGESLAKVSSSLYSLYNKFYSATSFTAQKTVHRSKINTGKRYLTETFSLLLFQTPHNRENLDSRYL